MYSNVAQHCNCQSQKYFSTLNITLSIEFAFLKKSLKRYGGANHSHNIVVPVFMFHTLYVFLSEYSHRSNEI